jgi:hypothetical protein
MKNRTKPQILSLRSRALSDWAIFLHQSWDLSVRPQIIKSKVSLQEQVERTLATMRVVDLDSIQEYQPALIL